MVFTFSKTGYIFSLCLLFYLFACLFVFCRQFTIPTFPSDVYFSNIQRRTWVLQFLFYVHMSVASIYSEAIVLWNILQGHKHQFPFFFLYVFNHFVFVLFILYFQCGNHSFIHAFIRSLLRNIQSIKSMRTLLLQKNPFFARVAIIVVDCAFLSFTHNTVGPCFQTYRRGRKCDVR
jgi:hypothetical protein